jgi:uncharacterized protein
VSAHVPIRTCVGCGGREAQTALVRFVATRPGLALDASRQRPGRGAYLHRRAECWTAFVRRRGPVRSLRATPSPVEREGLVAMLTATAAEAER